MPSPALAKAVPVRLPARITVWLLVSLVPPPVPRMKARLMAASSPACSVPPFLSVTAADRADAGVGADFHNAAVYHGATGVKVPGVQIQRACVEFGRAGGVGGR